MYNLNDNVANSYTFPIESVFFVEWIKMLHFNPFTAKLFNLNFHPLEAVSRWRDPQLQVSEN